MNFRQLRYVHSIVEYGTMREAAKQLFVTEPTISQQIRELEKDLEFPIFEKQGRNIILTNEGQALLPAIKKILLAVKDIESQINEIKDPYSGQVRLGIGPISASKLLPKLFKEFNQLYPNVKLSVFQGGSVELRDMLVSNQIDIAVVSTIERTRDLLKKNNIECKILSKARFLAVVSDKHHLAKYESISIHELSEEQLILYRKSLLREKILSFFGNDFEKNIIFSTENNETTRELIKLGTAISILPESYIKKWSAKEREGLSFLEFNDIELTLDPSCIYKKDRYLPQYMEVFIKTILKIGIEK